MPLANNQDVIITTKNNRTNIIVLDKVDLFYDEEHVIPYSVTKVPIEDGSFIGDNYIREPIKLTLKGGTVNRSTTQAHNLSRPADTWEQIRSVADSKTPITVTTFLRSYDNMYIENARIPNIDRNTGQSLFFELDLVEVPILTIDSAKIDTKKVPSNNNPAQNKTDNVDTGEKQAAGSSILNYLVG